MKNYSSKNINHTLLTDFYELTMANGYFELGKKDEIAYFDLFFRKVPDEGGFAIFAGLEQVVEYLENLSFTEEDIEFLRSKNCFSEAFLDYLRDFRFECDVWAIPEGTPVFPYEPLITVRGDVYKRQVYIPEFPDQGPGDQRSLPRYRGGRTRPHGDGSSDHQSAQRP